MFQNMISPVSFTPRTHDLRGCNMNDQRSAVYTHGHHESVLRSHQRRTAEDSAAYLLPYLIPGASMLAVGCGPGPITADLAARVAPAPVMAVDQFADVLSVARAEVE